MAISDDFCAKKGEGGMVVKLLETWGKTIYGWHLNPLLFPIKTPL